MNKILILLILAFFFVSCENERDEVMVKYYVTNSDAGFTVSYRGEDGEEVKKAVTTQSKDDDWIVSFKAEQGDIVYLSVLDTKASSFVKAMIIIDGKMYKQASRTNDTAMPVTVSGTIPY